MARKGEMDQLLYAFNAKKDNREVLYLQKTTLET